MLNKLFRTDNDIATAIVRLALGVVFFAHGAQKLLGWFGGYGFTGTMGFFTGILHIPGDICIPGDHRRILWRARTDFRIPDANCSRSEFSPI